MSKKNKTHVHFVYFVDNVDKVDNVNFDLHKRIKMCKKNVKPKILPLSLHAENQYVSHKAAIWLAEAVLPRSEAREGGHRSSGRARRSTASASASSKC